MPARSRFLLAATAALAVVGAAACSDSKSSTSSGTATAGASGTTSGFSTSSPTAGGTRTSSAPATVMNIPDLARRVRPSVVRVSAAGAASVFGQQAQGTGTGFIIDNRGYIVTNNHVATLGGSREASKITVDLADGTTLDAKIVGRDERSDLAVLKVDTDASKLQTLSFASADSIQVGEDVVAIGFPLNLVGEPTVTRGVISAVDRTINETIQGVGAVEIAGAIQTDAAINPGNSGGPLIDADGRVVGINTAGLRGGASEPVTGINFAVSAPVAQPIVSALIDSGTVRRGFLGVSIASVDRDVAQARKLAVNSGAIVSNITRDSAADKAGMRANDVIVKIGDQPISGVGDVTRALTKYGPGQTVKVEYYRGADKQTTDLTLQDRPNPSS